MKVIAWDTSSKSGCIVALEWDPRSPSHAGGGRDGVKLLSEWGLNIDATHSERLLWGVHQVLESVRWKLTDVDLIGVGVGPGSFTGLRIGVTTARTLAHSLKKPLIPISSLAVLARPAADALVAAKQGDAWVVASTDACKGELFVLAGPAKALRDCVVMADGDRPGVWKRGVIEDVLKPSEMTSLLTKKGLKGAKAKWLAVGPGRARYLEAWAELPKAGELDGSATGFGGQVQGRSLATLVWEGVQAGLEREALVVHPRYLRASDAEVKLKAGLLRPQPQ